jgi:hypothetical protein
MCSSIRQFTARMVVAIGIAVVGVVAIGSAAAYSAVERARAITQENLTQPFQSPVPKAEFRLSEHQQLRKMFLSQ